MTATTPTGESDEGRRTGRRAVGPIRRPANRDLLRDILVTGLALGHIDASRLDLKIAASALAEMGRAFDLFAHYRGIPKLTMFGSARTAVSDPLYAQAVDLAARMAARALARRHRGRSGHHGGRARRAPARTCRSASRSGSPSRRSRIPSSQPRAGWSR